MADGIKATKGKGNPIPPNEAGPPPGLEVDKSKDWNCNKCGVIFKCSQVGCPVCEQRRANIEQTLRLIKHMTPKALGEFVITLPTWVWMAGMLLVHKHVEHPYRLFKHVDSDKLQISSGTMTFGFDRNREYMIGVDLEDPATFGCAEAIMLKASSKHLFFTRITQGRHQLFGIDYKGKMIEGETRAHVVVSVLYLMSVGE